MNPTMPPSSPCPTPLQIPILRATDRANFHLLWIHQYRVTISASIAAIVGCFIGYPFDSIKTRMQTFAYPNLSHCVRQTYTREGLHGFFRGISPQLAMAAVFKTTSFAVYSQAKQKVEPYTMSDNAFNLFYTSFIAGGISGLTTGIMSQPLELIKVVRQLQSLIMPLSATSPSLAKSGSPSTYGIARELIRVRGPLGLFFGFRSHLLRDTLGGAVYFSSYETSKYLISVRINPPDPTNGPPSSSALGPLFIHISSGAICGLFAWTVIFPTDCIKSTIQRNALSKDTHHTTSVMACARNLYAQDGVRAFYRGISATWLRAAPLHALNWAVYEGMLQLCTNQQQH